MKNSFFSRFTPKEPKFFPLLKQLSEVLSASSVALVEVCNMTNRQTLGVLQKDQRPRTGRRQTDTSDF